MAGCWAYAKRKFDEALKSPLPKKDQAGSGTLTGKQCCDQLFAIERDLAELPAEERHIQRQERAEPVLGEFLAWLQAQADHLGKNTLGKAVHYTLKQWKHLERYLLDGRLEISNQPR